MKGMINMRKDTIIAAKHKLYSRRLVEGKIRGSVEGTMFLGDEVDIDYHYRYALMISPQDKAYKCRYRAAYTADYCGKMMYTIGDFIIFQRVSDDWQNGLYYFVSWREGVRELMYREDVTTYYKSVTMAEDKESWEY